MIASIFSPSDGQIDRAEATGIINDNDSGWRIETVDATSSEPNHLYCDSPTNEASVRVYHDDDQYGGSVNIDLGGTAQLSDYELGVRIKHPVSGLWVDASSGFYTVTSGTIHFPDLNQEVRLIVTALEDGVEPTTDDEAANEELTFTIEANGENAAVTIEDAAESLLLSADPDFIYEKETGYFFIRPDEGMPSGTLICATFRLLIDANVDDPATPPVAGWPLTSDPQRATVDYSLNPLLTPLEKYDPSDPSDRSYVTKWITVDHVPEVSVDVHALGDSVPEPDEFVVAVLHTQNSDSSVQVHNSDQIIIESPGLEIDTLERDAYEPASGGLFCGNNAQSGHVYVHNDAGVYTGEEVHIDISRETAIFAPQGYSGVSDYYIVAISPDGTPLDPYNIVHAPTGQSYIHIFSLTKEFHFLVVPIDDDPLQEAEELATFKLRYYDDSDNVVIKDPEEAIEIIADPDHIMESGTGAFIIKPKDDMPPGTELCTAFRLLINAVPTNAATPPDPPANWPHTDVPTRQSKDYNLIGRDGQLLEPLAEYAVTTNIVEDYTTQYVYANHVAAYFVDVHADLDKITEGDEDVIATLQTPVDSAVLNDAVVEHGEATIVITERLLDADLEVALEPDSDSSCSCQCPVCNDVKVSLNTGKVSVSFGGTIPFAPRLIGEGAYNSSPIVRARFDVPQDEYLPNGEVPDTISGLLTAVKLKEGANGELEDDVPASVVIGSFTFMVDKDKVKPGGSFAMAVQTDFRHEGLEQTGYQLELVATGQYNNDVSASEVLPPVWEVQEPYLHRKLSDSPIGKGLEVPGHKKLESAKLRIPEKQAGSGASGGLNQSASTSTAGLGETTYRDARGFVVYRSDNSASFYEVEDESYKTPAESLSTLSKEGSYYKLSDRYGNYDLFDETTLLHKKTVDRNGNETIFAYDPSGRITSVTDPLKRVTAFTYGGTGGAQTLTLTDFAGRAVVYSYNEAAGTLSVTHPDPDGPAGKAAPVDSIVYYKSPEELVFAPDDARIASFTQSDTAASFTHTTTLLYDSGVDDRVSKVARADGSEWQLVQHRMREGLETPPDVTLPLGEQLRHLVYRLDESAETPSQSFDDFFENKAIVIDGNGNETVYKLDHRGRTEEIKDALGNVYEYLLAKTPDPAADPDGTDRGEVELVTMPDPDGAGPLEALVTDPAYLNGNVISLTLPALANEGAITQFWPEYNDAFDRAQRVVNTLSHETIYGVDPENGNVLSMRMVEPVADPGKLQSGENAWHNYANRFDVDADGSAGPTDAFELINEINKTYASRTDELVTWPIEAGAHRYLDVNDDGYLSSVDVLQIFNWLNDPTNSTSPSDFTIGSSGDVFVEYVYTDAGDNLPRGLVKEEKVHTGRDTDGDDAPDILVTKYEYYNQLDGASPGSARYGLLQSVTYAAGTTLAATMSYFYDGNGNPSRIVDELNRETVFTYDDLNRLVSWIGTDPDGTGPQLPTAVKYDYDPFGNVLAVENVNYRPVINGQAAAVTSHVTRYDYDGRNRVERVIEENPDNEVLLVGVTSNALLANYLLEAIDPLTAEAGHPITVLSYDGNGNLTATVDALQRTTKHHYGALNRLEMVVSPAPGDSHFSLDGERRNADAELGEVGGLIASFTYDAIGNLRSATDALNHTTFYRYDAWSRIVEVVESSPIRSFANEEREALQDGVAAVDIWPLGFEFYDVPVTTINYDRSYYGWGQTVTDALGHVTSQQTDFAGRLRYVVEPKVDGQEAVTWFNYDQEGALRTVIDPLNNRTEYAYDARARLSSVSRPLVKNPETGAYEQPMTSFTYDDANQLKTASDPLGRVTTYDYDDLGRQILVTPPDPNTGIAGPDSPTVSYIYDAVGNALQVTDALDHSTTYAYDALFRQTSVTDANGDATEYTYDLVHNLKTLADARENATTWEYDGLDRVFSETNVLGDARTFQYDAVGNTREMTDRNGRVTQYDYDNLYRMTNERWLDEFGSTTRTLTYGYDLVSNLKSAADPTAQYTFTYDDQNRLDTETHKIEGLQTWRHGSSEVKFDHDYDLAGNRIGLTANVRLSQDFRTTYEYDRLYRMVDIVQGESGWTPVAEKHITLKYDLASQLTQLARYGGNGLVAFSTYGYDKTGRLTDISHQSNGTTLASYNLEYDTANRLTEFSSLGVIDDFTVNYTYDLRNQLETATFSDPALQGFNEDYAYDSNGNRMLDETTSQSEVETDNRIQSDGAYTFEYDGEGNRTKRTESATGKVTEYEWDHRNRLTSVTNKTTAGTVTQIVAYEYDVFDRRLIKRLSNDGDAAFEEFTYWVFDGEHAALEFFDADAAGLDGPELTHRYLYGPGVDMILADERISSANQPGEVFWPLTDQLGSVRDLVDESGLVRQHLVYNSFGERVVEQAFDFNGNAIGPEYAAAVDHLFGYTGRDWDKDTGLQNNRARWYDPEQGRWISSDPIGFSAGDANLYRYVGNQSTTYTDPSGLIGDGHHFVPQSLWYGMTTKAAEVFDEVGSRIANEYYKIHNAERINGISHDLYTKAVNCELNTYLDELGIKKANMTSAQARVFLDRVKKSQKAVLKYFIKGVRAEADEALRVGRKVLQEGLEAGLTRAAAREAAIASASAESKLMRNSLNAAVDASERWAKRHFLRRGFTRVLGVVGIGAGGAYVFCETGDANAASRQVFLDATPLGVAVDGGVLLGYYKDSVDYQVEVSAESVSGFIKRGGPVTKSPNVQINPHGIPREDY